MVCAGCEVSSKAHCPVLRKLKKPFAKVRWAKETTRKVMNKKGVKVKRKVRCGSWCALCYRNMER